jgi:hypothetical protein
MLPDVALPGRPEDRVDHGVADHIRVGMTRQSPRVGDPHAPQDQRPPFLQSMRVVANADSEIRHGSIVKGHESLAIHRESGIPEEALTA